MMRIAPDGRRLLLYGERGIELWSIEPKQQVFTVARPRTVVGRSRDGATTAAVGSFDHDTSLVLERAGTCVPLGMHAAAADAIAFSSDGRTVWASEGLRYTGGWAEVGGESRQVIQSTFAQWRTDTGALIHGLVATWARQVFPMMAQGRVGFAGEAGVEIYDLRGHLVEVAARPHVTLGPPDAHGARWLVRVGTGNGVIALWTRAGQAIPVAGTASGQIDALAFSPDGRLLASAERGGSVLITDVATGAALGTVALDHATFLWWSADSAQLVIDTARRFAITVAVQRPGAS